MKVIKDTLLAEAEEFIAEQAEEFIAEQAEGGSSSGIATACGEDTKIFLDKSFIRIPELVIDIYAGNFCNYNEEDDAWEPDYNLYVFYVEGDGEDGDPIYDEGGSSLEVCVYNFAQSFLGAKHITMEYIQAHLKCEAHIASEED